MIDNFEAPGRDFPSLDAPLNDPSGALIAIAKVHAFSLAFPSNFGYTNLARSPTVPVI